MCKSVVDFYCNLIRVIERDVCLVFVGGEFCYGLLVFMMAAGAMVVVFLMVGGKVCMVVICSL